MSGYFLASWVAIIFLEELYSASLSQNKNKWDWKRHNWGNCYVIIRQITRLLVRLWELEKMLWIRAMSVQFCQCPSNTPWWRTRKVDTCVIQIRAPCFCCFASRTQYYTVMGNQCTSVTLATRPIEGLSISGILLLLYCYYVSVYTSQADRFTQLPSCSLRR